MKGKDNALKILFNYTENTAINPQKNSYSIKFSYNISEDFSTVYPALNTS